MLQMRIHIPHTKKMKVLDKASKRIKLNVLEKMFDGLSEHGENTKLMGEAMAREMIAHNPAYKNVDKEKLEKAFAEARKRLHYGQLGEVKDE